MKFAQLNRRLTSLELLMDCRQELVANWLSRQEIIPKPTPRHGWLEVSRAGSGTASRTISVRSPYGRETGEVVDRRGSVGRGIGDEERILESAETALREGAGPMLAVD